MATNPRIPEQYTPDKPGSDKFGSKMRPEPPSSPTPGVILAIVVALLLLGAIFYFMPRTPKPNGGGPSAASIPNQPVPGELQISHATMALDPTGHALNLDAEITNTGQHEVNGIMAQVTLTTTDGQKIARNSKVMSLIKGRKGALDAGRTQDLTVLPIKPGEMRPVRMTVDNVPFAWNHQMPGIRIITVTAQ